MQHLNILQYFSIVLALCAVCGCQNHNNQEGSTDVLNQNAETENVDDIKTENTEKHDQDTKKPSVDGIKTESAAGLDQDTKKPSVDGIKTEIATRPNSNKKKQTIVDLKDVSYVLQNKALSDVFLRQFYDMNISIVQNETCHKRYIRTCRSEDCDSLSEAEEVQCDAPECFIENNCHPAEKAIDPKHDATGDGNEKHSNVSLLSHENLRNS